MSMTLDELKFALWQKRQKENREAWEAEAAYRKAKDAEMRVLLELVKENGRKLDAIMECLDVAYASAGKGSRVEDCEF